MYFFVSIFLKCFHLKKNVIYVFIIKKYEKEAIWT